VSCRPEGGYLVLLPTITKRKRQAWLQEYDDDGALLRDCDLLDGAMAEDRPRIKRESRTLTPFLLVPGPPSGSHFLASAVPPFVICRYDPDGPRLEDVREIWLNSSTGTPTRLELARAAGIDSKQRLCVLSWAHDGQPLLVQALIEGGGVP
jgi:hypothetical protein